MTKQIDVETLREWLEGHQPVTVVDVRTDEDRAQWAIPGSVHVNAYQSLRSGQPGALADAVLATDRPIVTVCGAGRMSLVAAGFLSERGFDVRSISQMVCCAKRQQRFLSVSCAERQEHDCENSGDESGFRFGLQSAVEQPITVTAPITKVTGRP